MMMNKISFIFLKERCQTSSVVRINKKKLERNKNKLTFKVLSISDQTHYF